MIHRWHTTARSLALMTGITLLLGAAPNVLAQEATPEEFAALLEQGQQQMSEEDFQAAVDTFSEAIRLTGGASGPALIGRATARKELEEYAQAQEDIKNALTYSGSDPLISAAAQNLSGEINMELGAYGDALADLQAATELNPNHPLYQFNLGKTMVILGGVEQGIKSLTKWFDAGIDDTEKNAEAYRLRAQATAQTGKFEDAMSDLNASLELEPDAHETYNLKGMILAIQEEYQQAADAYAIAIQKFEPEEDSDLPYVEAQLQRASVLEEAAKQLDDPAGKPALYTEERDECQRLLDALPDRADVAGVKAAALFRRGIAERYLGDLGSAVKSLSDAIDINPAMALAYFRRGICYFHLGEEQMAIDDFDKSSSIDFQSPHAALWKGRVYSQLGEHYEAIKAYGQALAVSDRYTDAYVNRGLTYVQLGEYNRAIRDFNHAIRLQPTNAEYYYFRGVAYSLQGDRERAVRSLAKAIELDDRHAAAHLRLADELGALGHPRAADEYRARGLQLGDSVAAE